jgi:hypothetical protein
MAACCWSAAGRLPSDFRVSRLAQKSLAYPSLPPPSLKFAQCRKWRAPVNTIVSPCSLAAAITSSSRIEPPGWMTALAPAAARTSIPSRNGKKASEATHRAGQVEAGALRLAGGNSGRVDAAHLAGTNAQGHAAATEDDGIGLDELGDAIGEKQVFDLRSLGARVLTTLRSDAWTLKRSGVCSSRPPPTRFISKRGRPWPVAVRGRAGSAWWPAVPGRQPVKAGASRTSTKCLRAFMAGPRRRRPCR